MYKEWQSWCLTNFINFMINRKTLTIISQAQFHTSIAPYVYCAAAIKVNKIYSECRHAHRLFLLYKHLWLGRSRLPLFLYFFPPKHKQGGPHSSVVPCWQIPPDLNQLACSIERSPISVGKLNVLLLINFLLQILLRHKLLTELESDHLPQLIITTEHGAYTELPDQ